MKVFFEKQNWEIKGFWLKDFLGNCKDWMYELKIKRLYKNRTLSENNYYWGVVLKILSDELWYEIDEVHEVFKERFLSKKQSVKSDKRIKLKRVKSTSELTTVEFEQYMDDIRLFAQQKLNIIIPLPNN